MESKDRAYQLNLLINSGKLQEALFKTLKAKELYEEDTIDYANIIVVLGNIYNAIGMYTIAVDFYKSAYNTFRKYNEQTGLNALKFNIALALSKTDQKQKAFEMISEVTENLDQFNEHARFIILLRKADVLSDLGKIEEATEIYSDLLEKTLHNVKIFINVKLNFAIHLKNYGKNIAAKSLFLESIALAKKDGEVNQIAHCEMNYWAYLMENGSFAAAEKGLLQSIEFLDEHNLDHLKLDVYNNLIRIYESNGSKEKQLAIMMKYEQIKNSFQTEKDNLLLALKDINI